MKPIEIYLFFFLLLGSVLTVNAQKVAFEYDAAGNRIQSKTIVMQRSTLQEEDKEQEEVIYSHSDILGGCIIRIYPNPTKGLLKVDIENLPSTPTARISLYSLSGKKIIGKDEVSSSTDLDITSHPEGIYILRISVGESHSEWKVIKE